MGKLVIAEVPVKSPRSISGNFCGNCRSVPKKVTVGRSVGEVVARNFG